MPSDHTPTRFTTLMVGAGTIAASVIAAAVAGSLISKGDLVFDTTDNSDPAIVVDETQVLTFGASSRGFSFPSTDSCISIGGDEFECFSQVDCTASGGNVSVVGTTATAVWQNPLTSSASVLDVSLDVVRNPQAAKFDIGTTTTLASSGSNLFNNKVAASGSSLFADFRQANPGAAASGSLLVRTGNYIRALATTTFPSASACTMRVRYRKYGT